MVVLILTCSSNVGVGIAYIVRDSREDVIDSSRSLYFGKNPTFPDYFGKSEESDFSIFDEFGSPEPFSELNNPHRNAKPHLSLNSGKNGTKSRKNSPSQGLNGRDDNRPGKRPILSVYDRWSPEEDEGRLRKPNGRPFYSSFKEDGEGGQKPSDRYALPKPNLPGPPYTPIFSSSPEKFFKSTPNEFHFHPQYSSPVYKHNSDQTLLSQYYKTVGQPSPTTFSSFYDTSPQTFNKDMYIHQHQYGIHHDYTPRGKGDEGSSFRSVSSKSPNQNLPKKPGKSKYYDGGNSWTSFKPSSPDVFLNKYANFYDFHTDFADSATNYDKRKNKRSVNPTSCVKKIKESQVGKNPVKWMSCLICVDEITGKRYEKCSDHMEKKAQETARKQSKFRGKRSISDIGHHQYEFEPDDDYHYGPDHHEYRFGPEHFTDEDAPVESHRENNGEDPHENESCYKKRKGAMLCIMCENRANGGTYEQCSYGSDPKKNSYENSVSKVYGTPRLPNERDKHPSEDARHPAPNHPQNNQEWHGKKGRYQHDNGNWPGGSNNRLKGRFQSTLPEPDRKRYRNGHKHIDVNKPNVFGSTNPYHISENFKPYGLPEPYKPEEPFVENEEPLRHQFREYRQSPFNYREPFEEGYGDSSHEVFPKVNSNPPSDYAGEYDEYDDYASAGDVEDGQGQFTANLQKHIGNPSAYTGRKSEGDFIEKAIGDFSNKNRSSCTKIQKDKMTCYQCVDERGSQKEECIYVAGNKPKTKQLSFREVKEFNYYPASNHTNHTNGTERSTNQNPTGNQRFTMNRDKRKFKKYYPESGRNSPLNTQFVRQARSSVNSTPTSHVVHGDPVRSGSKKKPEVLTDIQTEKKGNSSDQNVQPRSTYNAIPTDPPVFSQDVHYDVEHSDEIEMDFDPELGLSLPRYMLEKSEHEAIFDEALASG